MEISITVYLGRFTDTVKSYKVEEVPSFVQSIVSTFKKNHGCKITAPQIKALISLTSSRVLRTTGKVWDQLSMGDRLWVVTNTEWDNYQNNHLQAEALMRNGKVLVIRHPSFLSYEKLLHFIAQYHSDVIPKYPRKSLSSPDSKSRQSTLSTPKTSQTKLAASPNLLSPDMSTLKIVRKALIKSPASNSKIPLDRTLRLGDLLVSQQTPAISSAPTVSINNQREETVSMPVVSPERDVVDIKSGDTPTHHIAENDSSFSEDQESSYWTQQDESTVDSSLYPTQSLKDALQSYSHDREDVSTDQEVVDTIGDHSTIEGVVSVSEHQSGNFEQELHASDPTLHEREFLGINEQSLAEESLQNVSNQEHEQQINNNHRQEPYSDPESNSEPESEPESEPDSLPESDPEHEDSALQNEDSLPPPDDSDYVDISASLTGREAPENSILNESENVEGHSQNESAPNLDETGYIETSNSNIVTCEEVNIENSTDSSDEDDHVVIGETEIPLEEEVFDPTREYEDVINATTHIADAEDTISSESQAQVEEHLIDSGHDSSTQTHIEEQDQTLNESVLEESVPNNKSTELSEEIIDNVDASSGKIITSNESKNAVHLFNEGAADQLDMMVDFPADYASENNRVVENHEMIDCDEVEQNNISNEEKDMIEEEEEQEQESKDEKEEQQDTTCLREEGKDLTTIDTIDNIVNDERNVSGDKIVNDECNVSGDSNITTAQSLHEEELVQEDDELSTDSNFANLVDHVLASTPYQPLENSFEGDMSDAIIEQEAADRFDSVDNEPDTSSLPQSLDTAVEEIAMVPDADAVNNILPLKDETNLCGTNGDNIVTPDHNTYEEDSEQLGDDNAYAIDVRHEKTETEIINSEAYSTESEVDALVINDPALENQQEKSQSEKNNAGASEFSTEAEVNILTTTDPLIESTPPSLFTDSANTETKASPPSFPTPVVDFQESAVPDVNNTNNLLVSDKSVEIEEVLKQKDQELEETERAKQLLEARLEETRYLLQLIASGARAAPYASERERINNPSRDIRDLEDSLRFINVVDHRENPGAVPSTLQSTVNSPFVKGSSSPPMNRKAQMVPNAMTMKSVEAEERKSKVTEFEDSPDMKKRAFRVFPAESFDAMDNLETKTSQDAVGISFTDESPATVLDTIDDNSHSQDHDDGRYLTDSPADIDNRFDSPIMHNSPDNMYDDDIGSSGSRSSLSRSVGKSTSLIKRIASMRSHRMLMSQNLAKADSPLISRRKKSFHLHESNKKSGRTSPKLMAVASFTQATLPLRKPQPAVPSRVHYKISTKQSKGHRRSESPHQDNRRYRRHHRQEYDMDGEDDQDDQDNPRHRPELDIDVDDSASDCSSIFPYDMTPKVRRAYRSVDNTPASLLQQQQQQQSHHHHHHHHHHQNDQQDLERRSSLEETFRATVQSPGMIDEVNNISHHTPQLEKGSGGIAMGFPDDTSVSLANMDGGISSGTSVRDIVDEEGSEQDAKSVSRSPREQGSSNEKGNDESHQFSDDNQQACDKSNLEHVNEESHGESTSSSRIGRFQSLEYSHSQSLFDIKLNNNGERSALRVEHQDDSSPRSLDSSVALSQHFEAAIASNNSNESIQKVIDDEFASQKQREDKIQSVSNKEELDKEDDEDDHDVPPPPALPYSPSSPSLSVSQDHQEDSPVTPVTQVQVSEAAVADAFVSPPSKPFTATTTVPHRSTNTPSRVNASLQSSGGSGKSHQTNTNNHLSLSALALASNSSLDLLNAAAEAASETDAILQRPLHQQHPLPSSASRRPSNVSLIADEQKGSNYNSPEQTTHQQPQPHPPTHPTPAHFLFPSMLNLPSSAVQDSSSSSSRHPTMSGDSRASAVSPLSFNNNNNDRDVSRRAHYDDLDAMLNDVVPTTAVTDTSVDGGLEEDSYVQEADEAYASSSVQPKRTQKQRGTAQDLPLPDIADSLPLVLTFPKADLLGHLKRYYYPFLVAHKYSMSPQLKGTRHRLELLQSISEHDLLAWIVFQMFGGATESIIVTRIKTTQITRALTAAKLSKLPSSQLDLLLVKIKTALVKEGPAAMALAGLTQLSETTVSSSVSTSLGAAAEQLRTKTGTVVKKKLGASSSGSAQTNSSSSDATFPLFLQLLRQLPRHPSTATEAEHLNRISQAFVHMLLHQQQPDLSVYHRHTIEAAFSASGVFLRTVYATICPHLVSPCPLIGPALSLLKKLTMPAFALEDVDSVRLVWERNSEQLHQIYTFYATALETRRISLPGASAMKLQLSLENVRELLTDFHVLPQLVDVQAFYRLYRATKLWEWELAECLLRSAKVYLLQSSPHSQHQQQQLALSPHSYGGHSSSFVHGGNNSSGGGVNGLLGIGSSYSLLNMVRTTEEAVGGPADDARQQALMLVDLEHVPPLPSLNAAVADPADMIGSIGHLSLSYP